MTLFQFKWLRRFVRRHTSPIPEQNAELWKRRLSIVYMVIAWQAFGAVLYMMYTGRNDWARYYGYKSEEEAQISPAHYFAKMMNIEKGKIIRFSGTKKIYEEEIIKPDTLNDDTNK